MNREQFLTQLAGRGYSRDESAMAIKTWRDNGGTFDDEISEQQAIETPEIPETTKRPGYGQRVQSEIGKIAEESVDSKRKSPTLLNRALATAAGAGRAMGAYVSNLPGLYEAGQAAQGAISKYGELPEGFRGTLSKVSKLTAPGMMLSEMGLTRKGYGAVKERSPEEVKNVLTLAELGAQFIPAERIGSIGVRAVPKIPSGVSGAVSGAGEELMTKAARMQGTKVKVNIPEMKKGASNEMYKKYGVFGNAKEVQGQWQGKISDISQQLKDKINSVEFNRADPNSRINLAQVINRAKARAIAGTRINKNSISSVADDISNELKSTYDLDLTKAPAIANNVDLSEAQLLKQEIGKHGDWLSHNGKITANQDATNKAAFYNTLYDELKNELENKGGPGIRELNKQLSEMIPMERAAAKQVLVENRKNPISLEDYLGALAVAGSAAHGNILPAAVVLGNIATKSPSVAKGMYKFGKALSGEKKLPNLLASQRGAISSEDILKKSIKQGRGIAKGKWELSEEASNRINEMVRRSLKESETPSRSNIIEETSPKFESIPTKTAGIDIVKNIRRGYEGEMTPEVRAAVQEAAKRHGGIQNITPAGNRPDFQSSVSNNMFWYNTPDGSTHVIKLGDIIKNQRGAIGGISDELVGKPAIRDPKTGKIYVGGWRGHKDAITKGETSEIQERLKYQHLLDNSNKPTENVGFIDRNGNFKSRIEVEKEMSIPKSPIQMYHDEGKTNLKILGATGAAALGGLTLSGMGRKKERKK